MRRNFEFFVVVILLCVLGVVLLRSLERARDTMEESGVQLESAAIRAAILEKLSHREAFGGSLPQSDNPADWLATPLTHYRGVLDREPEDVSVWYYDSHDKVLAYRFRDGHLARFRLTRNAGQEESRGVLRGIGLQRLEDKPQQVLRK
ncbi:MAG: hypothetical protein D3M94_09605 [Rhodocyclales bacterium GT-UBC]|nr:MAG: hypothetical protein D3M94_09605 [Rhodocyclales bacterium GT-UBC]